MDQRKFYVYEIKNLINGKCYIGKTYNPSGRWLDHQHEAMRNNNCCLYNGMRKHGIENFTFTILEEFNTEIESLKAENLTIVSRNTLTPNGYNATLGGGGIAGYKHTTESRLKISKSAKRKRPLMTIEHRIKISRALTGRTGSKHTKESKMKISLKAKGRTKSAEHRAKLSKANLGKKWTPEHHAKVFGRKRNPHSNETKLKISVANTGKKRTLEYREQVRIRRTGRKSSAETCEKISIKAKARFNGPNGAALRAAAGLINKGKAAWSRGKKLPPRSEEDRKAISLGVKANWVIRKLKSANLRDLNFKSNIIM